MENKAKNEVKIMINQKEVSLRELTKLIFDIYKITKNECAYCKKNKIETAEEKLKLIKKLIERVIY